MTRSRKIMLVSFAAMLSLAGTALAAAAWTDSGTITDYIDYGNGAEVTLDATLTNPAGCGTTSRYRPLSTLSKEARERMSRAILAAYMAQKRVSLKIADGTGACTEGSPAYYAVRVAP